MKEFIEKYAENMAGTLSSFDRIIVKGHLPISWPEKMESLLRREKVLVKDFKRFVTKVSEQVVEHAKQSAEQCERPYRHLRGKKIDKEAEARAIAIRDGIEEGLVCVFSRVEQAQPRVSSLPGGRAAPGWSAPSPSACAFTSMTWIGHSD